MKRLVPSGAFRKDLKRVQRRGYRIDKLNAVLTLLQQAKPLPAAARPHKLSGEWQGAWECHIAPDWLLIYDFDESEVELLRTGTHADLFE
jgi:mRNA interferase YafQ